MKHKTADSRVNDQIRKDRIPPPARPAPQLASVECNFRPVIEAVARCVVCQLLFCCEECRWRHEKLSHGLTYDCPICRGKRFLCRPEELNQDFIKHLYTEHIPLQCKKCGKTFHTMEDFVDIEKCTSISELFEKGEVKKEVKEVEEKFDSLFKKVGDSDADNFEGIIAVNNVTKTAIITPIVRKKYLVDYDSSDTEDDDTIKDKIMTTPFPKLAPKTPKSKRLRAGTPHVKKFFGLMRQKVVEEYDENQEIANYGDCSGNNTKTPSRADQIAITDDNQEVTTPTSQMSQIIKLAQIVTTSTPTHPVSCTWSLFPAQGNDSPLSEIETTESPAQSIDKESVKPEENIQPKLKSIIVSDSKLRLGSQDSTEKQVTFQESVNNTESSTKAKKVTFADDTVFKQEPRVKRVYRKPKRMLTPGPLKPKYSYNPRFQALINRFETQAKTAARTPVNNKETKQNDIENTPPTADHNIPARAINFKDDSPTVETESSKESNELFKTCVDSPSQPINNAITALSANIAGSLQTCLSSVLRTSDEETEIQFKFVITKKKVSVKQIAAEMGVEEKLTEMEQFEDPHRENIWTTVTRVVRNVFWGGQDTPFRSESIHSHDSSSSASKRKFEDMSDSEFSPLNHKRHKYEGRIRGRPPLHRSRRCGVSSLRTSQSAEHQSLLKDLSLNHEDAMNLSF